MSETAVVVSAATGPTLDFTVSQWLHAKHHKSGSERTREIYTATMEDFRRRLRMMGADLDSPAHAVASIAQAWAFRSADGKREVSGGTANQRLAILSSFYTFAQRQGLEVVVRVVVNGEEREERRLIENPLTRVERAAVQRYAKAQALTLEEMDAALNAIDRSTLIGKRDYALILLGVTTGRRLNELRNLDREHLMFSRGRGGWRLSIVWPRAKGNKQMRDTLASDTQTPHAILDWLRAYYGPLESIPADAPVWISLSAFHPHARLSVSAMEYICGKRIGTTKVHTLRHTFALHMELAGAPVSEIKARLGHASLDTTGRYLESLHSDENVYVSRLEEMYGAKRKVNERS